MANINITSGGFEFATKGVSNTASESVALSPAKSKNDKILVLANLGGQRNKSLAQRKPIRIDKDNFEEVFEKLQVELNIASLAARVRFLDVDDLHPDFLYDRIELFAQYRRLQRQLAKVKSYDEALELINISSIDLNASANTEGSHVSGHVNKEQVSNNVSDPSDSSNKGDSESQKPLSLEAAGFSFDQLLSAGTASSKTASNSSNLTQPTQHSSSDIAKGLIRDIIQPYIETKQDQRIDKLKQALEQASNHTMRALMHSQDFQAIESSWRSLDFLNRRLDTDQSCQLYVLDLSLAELLEDLEKGADAYLLQLLASAKQTPGDKPFASVVLDLKLQSADQLQAVQGLMQACTQNDCWLLMSLAHLLVNEAAEEGDYNLKLPSDLAEVWQELSSKGDSRVICAAPQFLSRLPYGKTSGPIDSFDYEELPEQQKQQYYLWGNPAYMLAYILAGGSEGGAPNIIERMPLHVYRDEEGEEQVTHSAEYLLNDREAGVLVEQGFSVLRSVKHRDQIIVEPIQTY